jgi:hypothetical protein
MVGIHPFFAPIRRLQLWHYGKDTPLNALVPHLEPAVGLIEHFHLQFAERQQRSRTPAFVTRRIASV